MQRLDNIDWKSSFVSTQNEDNLSTPQLLAPCLHLCVCVPVLSDTAVSDNTNCTIWKCNPAGWNVFYLSRQWKINVFLVLFYAHKNIETIQNFVGNLFTFHSELAFWHDPLTRLPLLKTWAPWKMLLFRIYFKESRKRWLGGE